jgi:hypothetical protein
LFDLPRTLRAAPEQARNITAEISPIGFESSDGGNDDTAGNASRVVLCWRGPPGPSVLISPWVLQP